MKKCSGPLSRRLCSAILFPPIRAVLGFFWVGGAIGLGSGVAGLLPESMKPVAPLLLAIGALLGYWSFVRIVERRPVVELLSPGSLGEAAIGAAIGVGLFSAVIGTLFLLGGYSATVAKTSPDVMPALMAAVMAGVTEEVLIRAVAFRILEGWIGSWLALGVSAVLFGVMHYPNPEATAWSSAAIALEAGVMLAAAYMVTRRIWLPVGIHVAWNFTQSGIFGVPTSGVESAGYLEGHLHGSSLLTGGSFGPEASIAAVAVCLATGFLFLWLANAKGNILRPSWHRQVTKERGS